MLQRIAICYLAAALAVLWTGWRAQAAIAAALLLGYWVALTWVPVPGFGVGDLGREGSLPAWIDRTVLGPQHIWRAARVYDPEGILSTAPAVATTLGGALAGHWLRGGGAPARLVAGLAAAGGVLSALGLAWGLVFPINKPLWTSSYAVFTAGAALLALAACYWVIEIRRWRWWTPPFAALGVNALAVFFLSTLLAKMLVIIRVPTGDGRERALQALLFEAAFLPWATPAIASLAWACATVLLWAALAWPLFRRDIHLRA